MDDEAVAPIRTRTSLLRSSVAQHRNTSKTTELHKVLATVIVSDCSGPHVRRFHARNAIVLRAGNNPATITTDDSHSFAVLIGIVIRDGRRRQVIRCAEPINF